MDRIQLLHNQMHSTLLPTSTLTINNEQLVFYEHNPTLSQVLFLIHGNRGTHQSWREVLPLLQDFRVIAIDLRGFGTSSMSQSTTKIEVLADDVIKLCEAKGITKMTVNGWSMGGLVAMKVAEMKPELVQKIILTNAIGHTGYWLNDSQGTRISQEQMIQTRMKTFDEMLATQNRPMLKAGFEVMLFSFIKDMKEERKDEMVEMALQQRNTNRDTTELMLKTKIDLSNITAKWLVIYGAKDAVVPHYVIEPTIKYLQENKKNVTLVKFEGGHMAPMEETEKYVQLVKEFVKGE